MKHHHPNGNQTQLRANVADSQGVVQRPGNQPAPPQGQSDVENAGERPHGRAIGAICATAAGHPRDGKGQQQLIGAFIHIYSTLTTAVS